MRATILFAIIILFFASCTKSHDDETVLIRVKNQTANKIEDVKVYSGGSVELTKAYGTISENSASTYAGYREIYNIPLLSYSIAGAGVIDIDKIRCASPMPSTLEAGRYTLIVSGDYINPDVSFVKD